MLVNYTTLLRILQSSYKKVAVFWLVFRRFLGFYGVLKWHILFSYVCGQRINRILSHVRKLFFDALPFRWTWLFTLRYKTALHLLTTQDLYAMKIERKGKGTGRKKKKRKDKLPYEDITPADITTEPTDSTDETEGKKEKKADKMADKKTDKPKKKQNRNKFKKGKLGFLTKV